MAGVPYPTRGKNEGKNLGRKHPELSEKRRVFARKKRRGKGAERKSARKKHNAARARSPLEVLTFGTFNVRTAVVNGVFVPFPLSLCMESTSYVLSFRVVFFLPCDHGLVFLHQLHNM